MPSIQIDMQCGRNPCMCPVNEVKRSARFLAVFLAFSDTVYSSTLLPCILRALALHVISSVAVGPPPSP